MKKFLLVLLALSFVSIGFAQGQRKGGGYFKGQKKISHFRNRRKMMNAAVFQLMVSRGRRGNIRVKNNQVFYTKNAGMRRASYTTFVFTLPEFKNKIGSPKSFQPKKVMVRMIRKIRKRSKCSDPRLQCPRGGFRYTYVYLRIVSGISNNSTHNKKLQTRMLRISRRGSIRQKRRNIFYTPNSRSRRARYITYIFNINNFKANFPSLKNFKPKTVKIQVLRKEVKNTGCPKRGQCPRGGFTSVYVHARILSKNNENPSNQNKVQVTKMNKFMTLRVANNRFNEFKKRGGTLYYSVDASGRRVAVFRTYIFSYRHFLKFVGNPKTLGSKNIKIKIYRKTVKNTGCPNRGQCPGGGFTHIYYNCIILGKQ